jgi:hypothetical protein
MKFSICFTQQNPYSSQQQFAKTNKIWISLTRILIFTFQYADNNKNIFSESKLSQWYPGTKESDQTTSGQKGVFLVGIGRER